MEHVPRVKDPAAGLIEFPYDGDNYDTSQYANPSFDNYPLIVGGGKGGGSLLSGDEPDSRKILQTWFYFVMLNEVLGPVKQTDFLVAGKGGRVLTTVNLERYLESWLAKTKSRSSSEVEKILERVHRCLLFVKEALWSGKEDGSTIIYRQNNMVSWPSSKIRDLVDVKFTLAILILGTTLSRSILGKYGLAGQKGLMNLERFDIEWPSTHSYLDDLMLKGGWCPNEVARFDRMATIMIQLYALGLKRIQKVKHTSCTYYECKANNIGESQYKTLHPRANCTCKFLPVDMEAVSRILPKEAPGIPLVELTQNSDSTISMKVVPYTPEAQFVAVSHVWSDGMGNENDNALPQCQLQRLYKFGHELLFDPAHEPSSQDSRWSLKQISGSLARLRHSSPQPTAKENRVVTFWMDTLCIPAESGELKTRAIAGMKDIYRIAYRIMVLDSEIYSMSHNTSEETMLRIVLSSGWMRRLWTLQEGILAGDRLYVLLGEKFIRTRQLIEDLMSAHSRGKVARFNEPIVFDAYTGWLNVFETAQKFIGISKPKTKSPAASSNANFLVNALWLAVANRATSKDSDRPTVLASLLNVPIEKVLEVPPQLEKTDKKTGEKIYLGGGPDKRMKALYGLFKEFPQRIIFQRGERFDEDGWRWAVKSCKSDAEVGFQVPLGDVNGPIQMPDGIAVNFPGIVIHSKDIALATNAASSEGYVPVFRTVDTRTRSLTLRVHKGDAKHGDLCTKTLQELVHDSKYGVGLIFPNIETVDKQPIKSHLKNGLENAINRQFDDTRIEALMVSIHKESGGSLYCRRRGIVYLWSKIVVYDSPVGTCHNAAIVDHNQKWWIG